MLRTRILTALALLCILLPVLFFGSVQAAATLALVFIALACWEWMRLLGLPMAQAVAVALGWSVLTVAAARAFPEAAGTVVLGLSAAFWCLVAPLWLWRGVPATFTRSAVPLALLGLVILGATWWAIVRALVQGPTYLLSTMAIVWVSDIAAYFCGKTFGRRKLAPTISPGKTWEGAIGALGFVLVAEAAFASFGAQYLPWNYTSMLAARGNWVVGVLVLSALVALGIVGDLFESMLKRRVGVKDSSRLLPGHGGILDRIDALLPVLPVAVLVDMLLEHATRAG